MVARLASAKGGVNVSVIVIVGGEGKFGFRRVGRGFGGGIVGGLARFEKVDEKVDFGAILGWGEGRRGRWAVRRDRWRWCGLAG